MGEAVMPVLARGGVWKAVWVRSESGESDLASAPAVRGMVAGERLTSKRPRCGAKGAGSGDGRQKGGDRAL